MNRNFANGGKVFSMSAAPVMITAQINIGASGAVSSYSNPGNTISSIVRDAQGLYQINLREPCNSYIIAAASMQSPSVGLSGVLAVEIQNAASASISSVSDPDLVIKTLDAAGALVNPASGSAINVMIILNNSSVPS